MKEENSLFPLISVNCSKRGSLSCDPFKHVYIVFMFSVFFVRNSNPFARQFQQQTARRPIKPSTYSRPEIFNNLLLLSLEEKAKTTKITFDEQILFECLKINWKIKQNVIATHRYSWGPCNVEKKIWNFLAYCRSWWSFSTSTAALVWGMQVFRVFFLLASSEEL